MRYHSQASFEFDLFVSDEGRLVGIRSAFFVALGSTSIIETYSLSNIAEYESMAGRTSRYKEAAVFSVVAGVFPL